jgi:hypothetical protein
MAIVTLGFHRVSNVTALSPLSVVLQAVPLATITVSQTGSGAAATVYSDPALSISIPNGVVTADLGGNYDYYLPLNYPVTETISSPSATSGPVTIQNIVVYGPIVASFTTTSASSDMISIPGATSTGHVMLQPTNASAASMLASTYVSVKANGSITVAHPTTSGATFDVLLTTY